MSNNPTPELPGTQVAAPAYDEAIDFREVYRLLGLHSVTAHTALNYARRGQIRAVRLSARCIRYSRKSVLDLIAGRTSTP